MVINKKWDSVLVDEIKSENFINMMKRVKSEYETKSILPEFEDIFNVYKLCDIDNIKVVILGQDPYHTKGVANGIAFSVKNTYGKTPSSLRNIFKEIDRDLGVKNTNTDLTPWVKQGIFLLNTVLTVEEGNANSHKNYGWQRLTSLTIEKISELNEGVVFLLWGKKAEEYEKLIDSTKHTVLITSHPSGLSVNRGFNGCSHFSMCEEISGCKFDWQT